MTNQQAHKAADLILGFDQAVNYANSILEFARNGKADLIRQNLDGTERLTLLYAEEKAEAILHRYETGARLFRAALRQDDDEGSNWQLNIADLS